jgi:hypothetical protein
MRIWPLPIREKALTYLRSEPLADKALQAFLSLRRCPVFAAIVGPFPFGQAAPVQAQNNGEIQIILG